MCLVVCTCVGVEEHGDQSAVSGGVRDSAEVFPETGGDASGRVWY